MIGETPVIVLVGTYDEVNDEVLSAAGYRHYLNKPFDGSTLLETVKKAYPEFSLEKDLDAPTEAIDLGLDLTGLQKDVVSNISSPIHS